jgi:hypothetical protein
LLRRPAGTLPVGIYTPERARVRRRRSRFGGGCGKTFGGVIVHSPRSLAEWWLLRP